MDRTTDLSSLSTFDLAFNLATGNYSEKEKFEALAIIKSREVNKVSGGGESSKSSGKPSKPFKKPLKGSKAEKIQNLIEKGYTAKEIYEELRKKKVTVYYPEIYRLINKNKEA